MKKRIVSRIIIAFIVILTLFSLGCISTAFLREVTEPSLFKQLKGNEALKTMPAEASLVFALNPTLEQTTNFVMIWETLAEVPEFKEALDELQEDLLELEEKGFSFKEDIEPWLTLDFAISLINLEEEEPDMLAALITRDKAKSDAFLRKLRQKRMEEGEELVKLIPYKGVTIFYHKSEREGERPVIFATFKDLLLLSNKLELMQEAIDIGQGKGEALIEDENYQTTVAALPPDSASHLYLALGELIDLALEDYPQSLVLTQREAMEATKGLAASLSFSPDGIKIDVVISYDAEKLPEETKQAMEHPPNPLRATKATPAGTFFYLSGQNLRGIWDNVLETWEEEEDFQETVQGLKYGFGIDVEEDIAAWMTGEYALAILPDPSGLMGEEIPLGLLLLFEVEDKDLVEDKMESIVEVLTEQLGMSLEEKKIQGVKMQILTEVSSGQVFGYGFVGDFLVFGSSENMLSEAVGAQAEALADDGNFKKVIAPLLAENSGYLYLDIEKTIELVDQVMPPSALKDFDEEARPFLELIKAFSATTGYVAEENVAKGMLFFWIETER